MHKHATIRISRSGNFYRIAWPPVVVFQYNMMKVIGLSIAAAPRAWMQKTSIRLSHRWPLKPSQSRCPQNGQACIMLPSICLTAASATAWKRAFLKAPACSPVRSPCSHQKSRQLLSRYDVSSVDQSVCREHALLNQQTLFQFVTRQDGTGQSLPGLQYQ